MTSRKPPWFVNGSVQETVQRATEMNEDVDRIAEQLDAFVFDGVSRDRIERVVRRVQSREIDDIEVTLSQPPTTDETPRECPNRYVDSSDVQYLSDREFARVLGLVFEGFQGSTVRPAPNESVEPDLYWNRSHETIAFRTVSRQTGVEVDESTVTDVLEGESNREGTRAPSAVCVVTNGSFTEGGESTASDADVTLVDRSRLEAWFRLAKIDMETAGTVLEEGETHDGPLLELFDDGQSDIRCFVDPLAVSATDEFTVVSRVEPPATSTIPDTEQTGRPTEEETEPTGRTTRETADDSPLSAGDVPPGERGKLYADPDNDGDYEAFDTFIDDLDDQT